MLFFILFFFFKQKTAYEMRISDWSSDVCSSDLAGVPASVVQSNLPVFEQQEKANRANDIARQHPAVGKWSADPRNAAAAADDYDVLGRMGAALKKRVVRDTTDFITGSGFLDRMRSEERRVGTECVSTCISRWST